ncbi:MAG: hypothetical protein R2838_15110 [Caldilineaceae bacterium]
MWLALDLTATVRYHGALARSGGLADHADTSYHLAYYLRYNGLGAPIALDWGFDAPVRFLSAGTVRPIEVFGYASPGAPDADFAARPPVLRQRGQCLSAPCRRSTSSPVAGTRSSPRRRPTAWTPYWSRRSPNGTGRRWSNCGDSLHTEPAAREELPA